MQSESVCSTKRSSIPRATSRPSCAETSTPTRRSSRRRLQAIANQKDEAAQKNAFYDDELAKLKKLWDPRRAETRACVAPRD